MEIWGGAALTIVACGGGLRWLFSKWRRRRIIEVIQGEQTEVRDYSSPLQRKKPAEHFLWGNEFLDEDQASLHFLACGSTGSGKSINILLLMKTVVARMKLQGSQVRALVYDSKTDMLSRIRGMGLDQEDILVLNPFDKRRCAWDMARDITTAAHAQDVATLLVPLEKGSANPYFSETAQKLLSGMIKAFQQNAPGDWTLRDLVLASRDSEDIKAVLASCRYTEKLRSHFRVENTAENVCSTLNTSLEHFESVAASWERAPRCFSIEDWLQEQRMLVLGNSPKGEHPIRKINQLLFSSISKAVLGCPGRATAKHWFFLDELREMGVLDSLANMMIVGRSKGASMVLGFQDIHGLYAEYGRERTQEIVGCAGNMALLRVNPTQAENQQWASQVAGQLRYRERKVSESQGSSERGTTTGSSTSYELRTDAIYIPSFFSQRLPEIKRSRCMKGLYYTKGNLYEQSFPASVLFSDRNRDRANRFPDPDEDYSDLIPIDDAELLLEPWNDDDLQRLGIVDHASSRVEELNDEEFYDLLAW